MKAKTLLVSALALASLLIFAGCEETTGPSAPNQNATPNTPAAPAIATQAPVLPAISEADQAAYNGAIQLNDQTYCDKIIDQNYKNQCKTILADQTAQSAALAKLDPAPCDKISTQDKQDACKTQVDVAIKNRQTEQQKGADLNNDETMYAQMNSQQIFDKCNELKSSYFIQLCSDQALMREAITKKDISLCDKIMDIDLAGGCKQSLSAKNQ
jgi:hypothetical protein